MKVSNDTAPLSAMPDGTILKFLGLEKVEHFWSRALLWLSENPIVPTKEQLGPVVKECGKLSQSLYGYGGWIWMITEWQRRMFLAPGPDMPEAIFKLEPGKCPHRWQTKIDYTTMERVVYCEICCCEFSRAVGGEKGVR